MGAEHVYRKLQEESVEAMIQATLEVACLLRMWNDMSGDDNSELCGRIAKDAFEYINGMDKQEFLEFMMVRSMEDKYDIEGQISVESYLDTKEPNTSEDRVGVQ